MPIMGGISDVARNLKAMVGVNGVAKKVQTAYVGVNGVAKKVWQSGKSPMSGTIVQENYYNHAEERTQIFGATDYDDAIAQGHTQFKITVDWSAEFIGSMNDFVYDYGIMKQSSGTSSYFPAIFVQRISVPTSPGTYNYHYDGVHSLSELINQRYVDKQMWINTNTPVARSRTTITWSIEFI